MFHRFGLPTSRQAATRLYVNGEYYGVYLLTEEIRKELIAHLDDFSKQAEFPRSDRPMALKNLKIIAFVQDDATLEVLNAVQVDLEAK